MLPFWLSTKSALATLKNSEEQLMEEFIKQCVSSSLNVANFSTPFSNYCDLLYLHLLLATRAYHLYLFTWLSACT